MKTIRVSVPGLIPRMDTQMVFYIRRKVQSLNQSESKYFNTAVRMDKAFLELLEQKDFGYITIKEICEKAGVNRSTFYLHYETLADLLTESVQYLNQQFRTYFEGISDNMTERLEDCPLDELYFITPQYLEPYLHFIRDHKRIFCTILEKADTLRMHKTYEKMFRCLFDPILERHHVSRKDRTYMMAFYIHGLLAIITEWLKEDCTDSINHIIAVMRMCVMQTSESDGL